MKSLLLPLALVMSITILGCGSKRSIEGVWKSAQAPSSTVEAATLIFGEDGRFEASIEAKHPSAGQVSLSGLGTFTADAEGNSVSTGSLTVAAMNTKLTPELETFAVEHLQQFAGDFAITWQSDKEITLRSAGQPITFRKD